MIELFLYVGGVNMQKIRLMVAEEAQEHLETIKNYFINFLFFIPLLYHICRQKAFKML